MRMRSQGRGGGAIALGLGLSGLVLTLALSRASEAVDLLRFPLAWWCVVLALWGAVSLRHGRDALPEVRELALLAAGSVLFWDLFELLNLRLRNWWYVGLPRAALSGALFSAASFATVLPAARLGELLLRDPRPERPGGSERVSGFQRIPGPEHDRARALRLGCAGLAALVLALAAPSVSFPLAWIFLWPLCEAALCALPPAAGELRGPLEALRAGDRGVLARLLLFALPLGLLWEALNAGCARGWVYTVPHFEGAKIFEMPAPGYLGYLPFLLEAGAANALLLRLRRRVPLGGAATAALGLLLALVHLGVDGLGRTHTGVSLAQRLSDAQLPAARALSASGIETPRALLRSVEAAPASALADRATREQLADAVALSELAQSGRMGIPWAERLRDAGVRTRAELAAQDPDALRGRLAARSATGLRVVAAAGGGPARGGDDGSGAPRAALLRLWMRQAAAVSR